MKRFHASKSDRTVCREARKAERKALRAYQESWAKFRGDIPRQEDFFDVFIDALVYRCRAKEGMGYPDSWRRDVARLRKKQRAKGWGKI